MKKGFTLIELLAVIVILAIIALIATPIVLNIIEDSKKQSAINSAQLYVDGLSKVILNKNMIEEFMPSTCTVGETVTCDGAFIDYQVGGKKPTSGYINYSNGIVTNYAVCVMDYRVEKASNGITATKSSECSGGEPLEPNEDIIVYDGNGPSTELEGCGTEDTPYLIQSANDLIYMRDQVNAGGNITTTSTCSTKTDLASEAHYLQTTGIALNDTTNYSSWTDSTTGLYSWEPIGKFAYTTNPYTEIIHSFNGHYDGGNHSINGIYISNADSNQGLFGYTGSTTIENLKIRNSYITAGNMSGMLIGDAANSAITIRNINVAANIRGDGDVGGLIGAVYHYGTTGNTTVSNITVSGSIQANYSAGSVIGYYYANSTQALNISSVANSATISNLDSENDQMSAGGILGYGYNMPVTITNAINNGNITGFDNAGGIVAGCSYCDITITNSINHGDITHTKATTNYFDNGVGGLYGYSNGTSITITNSYNDGDITGIEYVGGIIGASASTGGLTMTSVYNTGNVTSTGPNNSGTRYLGGIAGLAYGQFTLTSSYNTGNITSPASSDYYVGGLVGHSSNGVIFNETYNKGNINIQASDHSVRIGGLVGHMGNAFSSSSGNSYNTGNITVTGPNTSYVSGIIGYLPGTSIPLTNVYNTGNITYTTSYASYTHYISGIAYAEGNVSNVYNAGNINVTNSNQTENYKIAGLVNTYWSSNSVQNSVFSGLITTNTNIGDVGAIGTYYNENSSGNTYNSSNTALPFAYEIVNNTPTTLIVPVGGTASSTMPTILSVINGNNKFKADTNNINGGNPILNWQ